MKAYNLDSAGKIKMSDYEVEALKLGEQGRARTRQIIPCPLGLKDGDQVATGTTRSGGVKIIKSLTPTEGWIARINTEGAYIKGGLGRVYKLSGAQGVKLLSKGIGAAGDAGGCGNWVDVLLEVAFGVLLKVKPRRYKPYYLWFGPDKVTKINEDEVAVLGDLLDIDIPLNGDAYELIN